MRVIVDYTGLLDIKGFASGGSLELPEGAVGRDVLSKLGVQPPHHRFITLLRNGRQVRPSEPLADGDKVHLLLPVGGG